MHALLWIQDKRKKHEKIDFLNMLRLAMKGDQRQVERRVERWARDAEIVLLPPED